MAALLTADIWAAGMWSAECRYTVISDLVADTPYDVTFPFAATGDGDFMQFKTFATTTTRTITISDMVVVNI